MGSLRRSQLLLQLIKARPIKENEPLSIFSKSLFIASQVLFVLLLVCLFAYMIFRFVKFFKKQKSIQKEAANMSRSTNCNMVYLFLKYFYLNLSSRFKTFLILVWIFRFSANSCICNRPDWTKKHFSASLSTRKINEKILYLYSKLTIFFE